MEPGVEIQPPWVGSVPLQVNAKGKESREGFRWALQLRAAAPVRRDRFSGWGDPAADKERYEIKHISCFCLHPRYTNQVD